MSEAVPPPPKAAGLRPLTTSAVPTLGYANIIIANKGQISDQHGYEMPKTVAAQLDKGRRRVASVKMV